MLVSVKCNHRSTEGKEQVPPTHLNYICAELDTGVK